jgi:hypothetical protein
MIGGMSLVVHIHDGRCRLRADPAKIRVGIRAKEVSGYRMWLVSVSQRGGHPWMSYIGLDEDVETAAMEALTKAAAAGVDGIDLDMRGLYVARAMMGA